MQKEFLFEIVQKPQNIQGTQKYMKVKIKEKSTTTKWWECHSYLGQDLKDPHQ